MYAELTQPRRRDKRVATSWPAECHIGDKILLGTVYDLSSEGIFFHPELHLTDGVFYNKDADAKAAEVGDEVKLRMIYRSEPDISLIGSVRWTGYSDTYGCAGFGIALEVEPVVVEVP